MTDPLEKYKNIIKSGHLTRSDSRTLEYLLWAKTEIATLYLSRLKSILDSRPILRTSLCELVNEFKDALKADKSPMSKMHYIAYMKRIEIAHLNSNDSLATVLNLTLEGL
jgi:hypothetical protein